MLQYNNSTQQFCAIYNFVILFSQTDRRLISFSPHKSNKLCNLFPEVSSLVANQSIIETKSTSMCLRNLSFSFSLFMHNNIVCVCFRHCLTMLKACKILTAALYCQNTLFCFFNSHVFCDKASSKDKISTDVLVVNSQKLKSSKASSQADTMFQKSLTAVKKCAYTEKYDN